MPDFGNAGTITARTNVDSTVIHVNNNEFLTYTLTTNAPAPVFAFACTDKKWLTSSDFPKAQATYNWKHFDQNGDDDNPNDRYAVTMLFLGAPAKYTLIINQCDRNGAVIQKLKDVDFSSSDPRDFYTSTLGVVTI
jgi:hypothetical protein